MLEYLLNRYGLPFTAIIVVITLTLAFSTCGSAQEPATSQEPATGKESLNQYTVTEKTHDIGCIDDVLGMDTTDDIVQEGRPPTGAELDKIQHCKVSMGGENNKPPKHETDKPAGSSQNRNVNQSSSTATSNVDEESHDIDCIRYILGTATVNEIIDGGRPATDQELNQITHCEISCI